MRRRTRRRRRSWLRADLRRLRGRDLVLGSRGLASLGPPCRSPGQVKIFWEHGVRGLASRDPLVGAIPWCASTTDYGESGGNSACAYCCGTDRGVPVPQIMPERGGGTACAV